MSMEQMVVMYSGGEMFFKWWHPNLWCNNDIMSYPVAVGCVFGEDDGVLWLLQLLEVVAADPCVAKWSWQQDWHCDDVTSLPHTCNDQTHHWCRYACNNLATSPFSVPFYCKCHSLDWCVSIFHLWNRIQFLFYIFVIFRRGFALQCFSCHEYASTVSY